MHKKTALALFLLVFLASCASPAPRTTATPEPPPPPTATATATFTATPEPTPTMTATPDPLAGLPEAVRGLAAQGYVLNEMGNMMVDPTDGGVGAVIGRNGEWAGSWTKIPNEFGAQITMNDEAWRVVFADGFEVNYPISSNQISALQYIADHGAYWYKMQPGVRPSFDSRNITEWERQRSLPEHFPQLTALDVQREFATIELRDKNTGLITEIEAYTTSIAEVPFDGVQLLFRYAAEDGGPGEACSVFVPWVTPKDFSEYYAVGQDGKVE